MPFLRSQTAEPAILPATEGEQASARWSRRRWLATAAAGLATSALGGAVYVNRIEPHWVEIVRRDMPITGLPSAMNGRTLLQLSDLHIGPIVDDNYLIASFRRAAALEPDIVVQTGDLIQTPALDWTQVSRVLEYFPKGRLATLAILGNHDYGHRWSNTRVGEETVSQMRSSGLTVLRNESHNIDGLTITGLEDMLGPYWRNPIEAGVIRNDRPQIVLCHNPDACDLDIWNEFRGDNEFRGWILAGHTHGGQVRLPLIGPPVLPVQNKRYTAGEFDVGGGRKLYINRALGYLRRVRFCVRPEMTLFTLRTV
jgi:uncharacterized protein